MPRNTKAKTYLSVAVPTDSRLMKKLEEDFAHTNTPKSHLLIGYANEYIRLFIEGEIQRIMPNSVTYALPNQQAPIKTEGERTLITSKVTDEDLEAAFGE